MSAFSARVATLAGVEEGSLERLAGGDLSPVLLVRRSGAGPLVAKGGPSTNTEAAMLRALAGIGIPVPALESEFDGVLMLEHVEGDGVFSARAWEDIGRQLARLHGHIGDQYGWPVDYRLGTVDLDNRERADWPGFWAEQRLLAVASVLDRPWRERVEQLAGRMADLLPAAPPPAWLHGDLWSGNILVRDGGLAAFIDPACYHGHAEVDLAMLHLLDAPPPEFWQGYGGKPNGWEERLPLYQLFPALVHLRLFGTTYAPLVDRLLQAAGT